MIKFFVILTILLLYGCNYPDIDDIPYYSDLVIDYKDKKTIRNLTSDRYEIIPTDEDLNSISYGKTIKANKQYSILRKMGMKYK